MLIFFAPGSSEVRPVRHFSRPPIQAESKNLRFHLHEGGGAMCVYPCVHACVCASETWYVLMCGHTWGCVSSPALKEGLSMFK